VEWNCSAVYAPAAVLVAFRLKLQDREVNRGMDQLLLEALLYITAKRLLGKEINHVERFMSMDNIQIHPEKLTMVRQF
jgi:hypothetical protein